MSTDRHVHCCPDRRRIEADSPPNRRAGTVRARSRRRSRSGSRTRRDPGASTSGKGVGPRRCAETERTHFDRCQDLQTTQRIGVTSTGFRASAAHRPRSDHTKAAFRDRSADSGGENRSSSGAPKRSEPISAEFRIRKCRSGLKLRRWSAGRRRRTEPILSPFWLSRSHRHRPDGGRITLPVARFP